MCRQLWGCDGGDRTVRRTEWTGGHVLPAVGLRTQCRCRSKGAGGRSWQQGGLKDVRSTVSWMARQLAGGRRPLVGDAALGARTGRDADADPRVAVWATQLRSRAAVVAAAAVCVGIEEGRDDGVAVPPSRTSRGGGLGRLQCTARWMAAVHSRTKRG